MAFVNLFGARVERMSDERAFGRKRRRHSVTLLPTVRSEQRHLRWVGGGGEGVTWGVVPPLSVSVCVRLSFVSALTFPAPNLTSHRKHTDKMFNYMLI